MSVVSKITRGLVSSFLILALSAMAFADTIRLKDGSRIKGRIISFKDNRFVVELGTGERRKELMFAATEIESIQFDSLPGSPQLTSDPNRNAGYNQPRPADNNPTPASPDPGTQPPAPKKKVFEKIDPGVPSSVALKTPGEIMKPIEWQIKVTADNTSNGWTNSGWVVKKGQRIKIVGEGTVSLGRGNTTPASGISTLADDQKLLKNVPTGALVAVIGDDNNDFIYIGAERELTASRDGALFLGINEGKLDDNSGAYDVKIAILPSPGE